MKTLGSNLDHRSLNATVSLWSPQSTAQYATTTRKGEYYRGELPLNNNTGAVWMTITNLAVLNDGSNPDIVTNTTGNVFVPKTAEVFQYDRDGNLTNDGRWTYTWDAENRLTAMTSLSSAPAGSKRKLEFAYDSKGRRIQKIVSTWNGSSYVAQSTNRFVYDGWNLIAILNPQSSVLQSFVWGLDLSGTEQGAGGVGGLLLTRNAELGTQNFVGYDGNGNLTALVKATDGAVTANYEYGPFGEAVRLTGAMSKANSFRFSTKYQDDETDLLYYGYRSYNPNMGRWLSRDPIEEEGGAALLVFLNNNPVQKWDLLGLCDGWCGPDVSTTLRRTLVEIENTYRKEWSITKKFTACSYLVLPWEATDSWDIHPLAVLGMTGGFLFKSPAKPGTEGCDRTVAYGYGEGCYHAAAVNYMAYGKMNKLCQNTFGKLYPPYPMDSMSPWSLDQVSLRVILQKAKYRGALLFETLDFTRAGYKGTGPLLGGIDEQCTVHNGNFTREETFPWRWMPWSY